MLCADLQQFFEDLHDLLSCAVRLYDDRGRCLFSTGGAQPICLLTHSSEFKSKCATLTEHCCAFDAACWHDAAQARDVVLRSCPLGFYTATCPIYSNDRLLGFLQVGDLLPEGEAALERTRELVRSYLVGEDKRVDERLSHSHCHTEQVLRTLPSVLRASCSYIESRDLFPTDGVALHVLAKQYIRLHLQRNITLEDVAEHLHCSRSSLTKSFKRECGVSIMQYVAQLRMERACRQLLNSELPISTICESCGFSSLEYFSSQFKKTHGISPTLYRKNNKKAP